MTGIAIVGTDHPHVVELTQQLVAAEAHVCAIVATEDRLGPWLTKQYEHARTDDPYADDVDIVVTGAIPSNRAAISIEAMRGGKTVVSDKPGVTTPEQLDDVRAVQRRTQQRWLVVFGERLGNPAMLRAEQLVRAGAIGEVIHTVGLGPHTLDLKHRPQWFLDPARYGGILVDIGSHQVDQFLAFTGARDADVVTAHVRVHDEHPGVQVLGEMLLRTSDDRTGYARVDYFTPHGLGAWGDTRFTVVGSAGTLDIRTLDNTVFLVDGARQELIHARDEPVTWAQSLVSGAMPIDQEHVFTVHDVCLRAQRLPDLYAYG